MTKRLLVISGAGLSAESGIRTFRTDSASGKAMWDEYDINEVCDIHAFNGNFYHKTHMFYNKRREELAKVEPNAAHKAIAELYNRYTKQIINLTTNVDPLLEVAGIPREEVLHVHGYLPEIRVKDAFTQKEEIINVGYKAIEPDDYDWVKPNVVFFGEAAPLYQDMYNLFDSLTGQDMVIVVGCSNQVINFNWELFPMLNIGTRMIVINPDIKYHEQLLYEERGVLVYRCGAVEAFTNPKLIEIVENHLQGKTALQCKG